MCVTRRISALSDAVRGRGRIVGHGRQHKPVEDGERDRILVVEGVHDDNEIELRQDEKALAATAKAGGPGQVVTAKQRTAKPPLIPIV